MRVRTFLGARGLALQVLVPTSRGERIRGLRGRHPTPMLFERARSVHTIGMQEPIVVAFLDGSYRVIRVTTVPPRRIVWALRARHVLEMPAGAELHEGDRVEPATAPVASR